MRRYFLLISFVLCFWNGNATTDPIFPIGTKWTYDFQWYVPAVNDSLLIGIYQITVSDTFRRNDSLIYVLSNNRYPNSTDWMYQDGEKIYLWINEEVGWQLTYDFEEEIAYESLFHNPKKNGLDTAVVEVETGNDLFLYFGDRGNQPIQKLTVENNGTYEDMDLTADILHHCGNLYGGLHLGIGLGLADPPYIISNLRCFEQGAFSYNFTEALPTSEYVACDSVRFISAVKEDAINAIKIFPNPANDYLTLDSRNPSAQYIITDYSGRAIQKGTLDNGRVDIKNLRSNVYFIQLYDASKVIGSAKFLKN